MPLRTHRLPSLITRLVLLSLAAVCLAVLRPAGRAGARVAVKRRRRSGVRRVAVSLTFATLFFAHVLSTTLAFARAPPALATPWASASSISHSVIG